MRTLAVILAMGLLALAMATVTATATPGAAGERSAKAKHKRPCPAGGKGRPCRRRARCASRPKRCRTKARRSAPSPSPAPKPDVVLPAPQPRAGPSPGATPPPALGRSMAVTAREWSLITSRAALAAGSQTIELRNWGEDPHNLVISPDDGSHSPLVSWEEQGPGTYEVKDTGLTAGRYLLWCSLDGHEARGMATTVSVEP